MHLPDPDDVRPYSSWDVATHGPDPRPGWVVTELSALDTELGILKTGKEADVHLVHRGCQARRAPCSRPSDTGRPNAACSTGTRVTPKAAESAVAARLARWPGAPSSGESYSPVSGRPRNLPR